jgi:hypothetical protein
LVGDTENKKVLPLYWKDPIMYLKDYPSVKTNYSSTFDILSCCCSFF